MLLFSHSNNSFVIDIKIGIIRLSFTIYLARRGPGSSAGSARVSPACAAVCFHCRLSRNFSSFRSFIFTNALLFPRSDHRLPIVALFRVRLTLCPSLLFIADGYVYDRPAIEAHLKKSSLSPVNKTPVPSRQLTPNEARKTAIQAYRQEVAETCNQLAQYYKDTSPQDAFSFMVRLKKVYGDDFYSNQDAVGMPMS